MSRKRRRSRNRYYDNGHPHFRRRYDNYSPMRSPSLSWRRRRATSSRDVSQTRYTPRKDISRNPSRRSISRSYSRTSSNSDSSTSYNSSSGIDDSIGHYHGGPGSRIGSYTIGKEIGLGTFGKVFEAKKDSDKEILAFFSLSKGDFRIIKSRAWSQTRSRTRVENFSLGSQLRAAPWSSGSW